MVTRVPGTSGMASFKRRLEGSMNDTLKPAGRSHVSCNVLALGGRTQNVRIQVQCSREMRLCCPVLHRCVLDRRLGDSRSNVELPYLVWLDGDYCQIVRFKAELGEGSVNIHSVRCICRQFDQSNSASSISVVIIIRTRYLQVDITRLIIESDMSVLLVSQ